MKTKTPKYQLAWKSTGKIFSNLTFETKKAAETWIKGHKSKGMDRALMAVRIK